MADAGHFQIQRARPTFAGIAVMAMSALDIALWDVLGKAAKLPLHRLWGHYRAQPPAYGSRSARCC
jgi:L-alanine-DL-glutamate epimerase-like enolase superfamily enzyme